MTIKFTQSQKRAICMLAKRDRRTQADMVRELVEEAARQRGDFIRRILDGEEDEK